MRPVDRWTIEAVPQGLLDAPLDYFFAEHHRQRQAAHILALIADGGRDKAGIQKLSEFLRDDLAQHILEEEMAFFPALREWCLPEDDIEALLMRLAHEHRQDEIVGDEVLAALQKLAEGGEAKPWALRRIRHFSEHLFQHIALENAVLLPIARARMGRQQEEALAALLKQGHGRTRI